LNSSTPLIYQFDISKFSFRNIGIQTMPVSTKKQPKSEATTTETTVAKSLSVKGRNEVRKMVYNCEDNREFHPLDPSVIRPIVVKADLAKFDSLIASGDSGVVEIDLNQDYDASYAFIHGWLKANGKNRSPKATHYGYLAEAFRKEFSPDATHWVLDANGMVRNGGHSGHAVALAFYPPTIEYGIGGKPEEVDADESDDKTTIPVDSELADQYLGENSWGGFYYEHNGLVYQSRALEWKNSELARVGDFDEDGNYVLGTDSPEVRTKQNLRITLRINADPTSCLKMDDVRLEASFDDYLEMVAPIRAHLSKLPPKVSEMAGQIFRNYYLRVNHKSETYGFLGKGGRLTKSDVQQWYIAGIPQLLDCVELLKNDVGALKEFPHFTAQGKTQKGKVSLMHALVAMMVSDANGRKKIAKTLTEQYAKFSDAPESFRKMANHVVRPSTATGSASADEIVQMLVFLGQGKPDPYAALTDTYKVGENDVPSWQVGANRVNGWDKSNDDVLDDATESFTKVCIDAATHIAKILGDEGGLKNAKMKATRKGVGSRGKNSK
jgi:hypothetical protein